MTKSGEPVVDALYAKLLVVEEKDEKGQTVYRERLDLPTPQ
jgi:hypothetical protein